MSEEKDKIIKLAPEIDQTDDYLAAIKSLNPYGCISIVYCKDSDECKVLSYGVKQDTMISDMVRVMHSIVHTSVYGPQD